MGLASITNNILTDTGITPSGVISGTLASGQVAYGSAANTIAGSNNLFWDNANGRLGIGTNVPANDLTISKTVDGVARVNVTNLSTGANAFSGLAASNSVGALVLQLTGTGNTVVTPNQGRLTTGSTITNGLTIETSTTAPITIGTNNTIGMTMFGSTRNVVFQNGGTFTDSGQRLQVYGDAFIKGSGNASTSTALSILNTDNSILFDVRNDARARIGLISLYPTIDKGNTVNTGGGGLFIGYAAGPAYVDIPSVTLGKPKSLALTPAANSMIMVSMLGNFAPTSGNATFFNTVIEPTINQVGATGITRGLYVNPTLTAAADWRSIEWSNNSGWGLYGAGTAQNFLAGNLGIGTTTLNNSALRVNKAITGAVTQSSIANSSTINSDVTSNAWMYVSSPSTQAAAFTIGEVVHFNAFNLTLGAGSAVTNHIGFRANASLTSGTNVWGFYGDIPSGTGRWNLYMNGTADNYLAGSLGIGNTSFAGMNLRVSKSITGSATGRSVYLSGDFQSDVSVGYGVQTSFGTQAATFTLSDLIYFQAAQGTKGAGSTIGTQVGFDVASMTNGSTNIAFRGQNASASNVWNLYMNGTAANYLNGSLLIGSATDDGINKLQVTGSILATTNSTISGLSVGKGAGNVATNTALGASALITNSTGVQNTAVGNEALRLNTTGLQNSAFGYRSSRANTTGSTNSAFGIDTLRVNTTGNNNAAFGAQALDNNTAGNNTAIGTNALLDNTSGVGNTALGYRAGFAGSLLSNITGSNNIFIGADSLGESTSDSNRTFIGNTSTTSTWLGGRLLLGSRTDDAANRLQVTGNSALVGVTYINTNSSIAGYGHSLQVLANAAGGMVISTTNSASAIGIINSSSANKTWDISPNNNDLAINESGVANGTRMYFLAGGNITVGGITNSGNLLEVLGTFSTTGVNTLSNLGGVGSRMVVADANGVLSTQAIPGGSITGTGVAGQVTYWTGASSQAGNAGFTFSPGNKLFLNNTVVAATNVARGFHITSQLSAFASNDDLVGIDLSPVYTTSGLPANVHTIGIRTASSFTPTQTDIRYTAFSVQPSINQGGTATGITRGVHVNPTITAVVDWRSVEWSNNTGWGIYGAGSAQNLLNGKLTVSPTILAANFTNANTISVLASQVLNIPTGNRGADGNVYSAVTGANYFRFNGATTLFGDSLWSGSVSISNIQFDTTGTITMANSATTGYRPLSVMQLQMQASGANNGTVDKGATLFIQGVYPASLTGTVTFTDYAAVRINDLREWGGTTVVLTNRWGIYQAGADDKNYFAASVGVGVATPNASAKLQVDSTTQGFLPPRMTTTQRNAIVSPAAGLIVYDTDLNVHYGYNGTTWNAFY